MSTMPLEWQRDDAWCAGCNCLVELCECEQKPAGRCECNLPWGKLYHGRCFYCHAKRLDLEGQLELSVIDSKLTKLLKDGTNG